MMLGEFIREIEALGLRVRQDTRPILETVPPMPSGLAPMGNMGLGQAAQPTTPHVGAGSAVPPTSGEPA